MDILTSHEEKILQAIKSFFARTRTMPTVREIQGEAKKFGLSVKSIGSIFLYLKSLERKNYIARSSDRKRRGIELVDAAKDHFIRVPLFGSASAGTPVFFAEQNIEGYLRVSSRLLKNDKVFGLRIAGDSMKRAQVNGKHIEDGDFILVDTGPHEYRDGDKVLVVIDGLATVKNFKRVEKRVIGLFPQSSNPVHQPIYLTPMDDFIILGKVIDVLKHFY